MNNSNARHIATNKRCRVEVAKNGMHFCSFHEANGTWYLVSVLAVELDSEVPSATELRAEFYDALKVAVTAHISDWCDLKRLKWEAATGKTCEDSNLPKPALTTQLYNALQVFLNTHHIVRHLMSYDPQALRQADAAAKLYEGSLKLPAEQATAPTPLSSVSALCGVFEQFVRSLELCERRKAERRADTPGTPHLMRRCVDRRKVQPNVEVPRNSTTLTLSQLRVLLCVKQNGNAMLHEGVESELVKLGYLYKVGGGLTLFGAERVEAALKGEKA